MLPDDPALAPDAGWTPVHLPHLTLAPRSYVAGEPEGDRLRVLYCRREADGALIGKVWFGPGAAGPPGHAHGGSIAAVIDEAMGGCAWLAGHAVVAAELVTRFRSLLPLGTVCLVEARVTDVDGRKVRTRCELRGADGTLHAEGEGLYVTLGEAQFSALGAPRKPRG